MAPPDGAAGEETEDSAWLQWSAEHVPRDWEYYRRDEGDGGMLTAFDLQIWVVVDGNSASAEGHLDILQLMMSVGFYLLIVLRPRFRKFLGKS